MEPDRNLVEVVEQMFLKIPREETALRAGLIRAREDAAWKAPEAQSLSWGLGAQALRARFGEPPVPEGWPTEIFAIWMGHTAATDMDASQNRKGPG